MNKPFIRLVNKEKRDKSSEKYPLKLPVINALMSNISSVIRGQIKYNDIKFMSPVSV